MSRAGDGMGPAVRHRAMRLVRRGTALLALIVTGCSLFQQQAPPRCPQVLMLKEAGSLVRYAPGPGRDLTDVLFEAKIADFKGSCKYDRKRTKVAVDLAVTFEVQRGPANRDRKAAFEYFVAIPRFYPAPEGKRRFPVALAFKGNRNRVRATDKLALEIPIAAGAKGTDYPIYLGFQLAPGEIEENRRRRGR